MFKRKEESQLSDSYDDKQLFNYIKAQNNDMISLMSGDELQNLLYYLDNYYLELRDCLGFDENITFGLELEFENSYIIGLKDRLKEELSKIKLSPSWYVQGDATLIRGAEISSPILTDKSYDWDNLKQVCGIVSQYASIGKNSGGHIHIGTQVLGNKTKNWLNFIKIWSVYENIIYRFVYGEFLNARTSMRGYAEPILRESSTISLEDIKTILPHYRYQAVSFGNVSNFETIKNRNTIEFRCPNGTLNPIIWQNNVNFFVNLLLYSKSSRYNDDIVESRKQKNGNKYSEMYWYEEIYLQQALEFCDMVFTNNLDKVYFLRQYLKSYETATSKSLSKAQEFTRKLNI